MAASDVPEEARPYLQYLPMIADYIRKNRKPTRMELSMLRILAPDAFRRLRELTYEELLRQASPFESHPQYGTYVALVKTAEGREWIQDVLAVVRSM